MNQAGLRISTNMFTRAIHMSQRVAPVLLKSDPEKKLTELSIGEHGFQQVRNGGIFVIMQPTMQTTNKVSSAATYLNNIYRVV